MTTASTRVFDELAKIMTNAAGAAQGARREIDTLIKTQIERVLNELDVVKRDEFEAVKEMAAKARQENDELSARIAKLEKAATPAKAAARKPAKKPATRKAAKKPAKKAS